MASSEAHKRATRKYQAAHYEAMRFDAPIGFKDQVRAAAQAAGVSPSQFMRDAIIRAIEEQRQEE